MAEADFFQVGRQVPGQKLEVAADDAVLRNEQWAGSYRFAGRAAPAAVPASDHGLVRSTRTVTRSPDDGSGVAGPFASLEGRRGSLAK
jgi:hypothetical protein